MSTQNEMRRVKRTNLEHMAKRLRGEITSLSKAMCINLDTSLCTPEQLPILDVDSQFDDLKAKWGELIRTLSEIAIIDEALK